MLTELCMNKSISFLCQNIIPRQRNAQYVILLLTFILKRGIFVYLVFRRYTFVTCDYDLPGLSSPLPSCQYIRVGLRCFYGGESNKCDWPRLLRPLTHPHIMYNNGLFFIPPHHIAMAQLAVLCALHLDSSKQRSQSQEKRT